jgi:hypothetical protein
MIGRVAGMRARPAAPGPTPTTRSRKTGSRKAVASSIEPAISWLRLAAVKLRWRKRPRSISGFW